MSVNKASVSVSGIGLAAAIVFTFAHGGVVTVNASTLPQTIQDNLFTYGLRQKLQDAYSSKKDPAEAQKALESLVERLTAGDWNAARQAGTAGSTTKLAQALFNVLAAAGQAKTLEEVQIVLKDLDEGQIKGLKAKPAIAAELAKIRAEELAAKAGAGGGIESLFAGI
jgi:alpha-N-acetylglucosamine transferase